MEPPDCEAFRLQLLVGLEHGVRFDRQLRNHVADLRLVAEHEVSQPQRVLDLMDELQVGRHTRSEVEAELDRRNSLWSAGLAVGFIYCHKTIMQKHKSLSTSPRQFGRD